MLLRQFVFDLYVLMAYYLRMMKKLTISISEEVYDGLYAKIGAGRISRFLDNLARPHVVDQDIDDGYKAMSRDDGREAQANEWTSGLVNEAW